MSDNNSNSKISNAKKTSKYPFIQYLYNHEVTDDCYNLVKNGYNGLISGTGKYLIPDDDWDNFYDLAYSFASTQKKDGIPHILNFNQKINTVGPLTMDFDIVVPYDSKYEIQDKNKEYHIYTKDDIRNIVSQIHNIIRKSFIINIDDLKCYITEKLQYTVKYDNNEIKDGFHIFYNIPFSIPQKIYIYNNLVKKLDNLKILNKYNIKENYDKIVDPAVIDKNFWMIYGSVKQIKDDDNVKCWSKPYTLTICYDENVEEEEIDATNLEIAKFFNIRQYKDDEIIKTRKNIEINPDITFIKLTENNNNKKIKTKRIKKAREDEADEFNNSNNICDLSQQQFINLFEILSKSETSYDYNTWHKLLLASKYESTLSSNSFTNPSIKDIFYSFSSKDPKKERFDEKDLDKKWNCANINKEDKKPIGDQASDN